LAVKHYLPSVKTIIEMGGEDSKLIILDDIGIDDFSMNSVCAAGTGSFLEQQAERLNLSIEEFSKLATQSKSPPRIAGRCSVFAKSDMIHLQQIASPVEDIVAGLCFAVSRNFKGAIVKGRKIVPPISFQGGVAANEGIVRAFNEIFDIDVIVPDNFLFMGAIGSIIKDKSDNAMTRFDITGLKDHMTSVKVSDNGRSPLIIEGDDFLNRHGNGSKGTNVTESKLRTKTYLGIDIGSISTNLAVIDEKGKLISKRYLMTAGRPIDAVMRGLKEIGEEVDSKVEIIGVG
jgi:activator of 2-hydroxyglutaryl-CoA dehydratase